MLSILKENLLEDETILRFDLLALNQRCIELLRKIQKVCVEQSPIEYPADEYGLDIHVNDVVSHMLAGVLGLKRYQPTRFLEACVLVNELIEAEGDAEWNKANDRRFLSENKKHVTDNFKTPVEDTILLHDRQMFSRVMIHGEDGSFRIL